MSAHVEITVEFDTPEGTNVDELVAAITAQCEDADDYYGVEMLHRFDVKVVSEIADDGR